ncbi:MAG TPA: hypothetical protein VG605_14095, partial [Puia sp.]|nr:hypothetical protein [Puia sp.]
MTRSFTLLATLLLTAAAGIQAQPNAGLPEQLNTPVYDPAALFAPGFYGDLHLATRSPDGAPSSAYWQNRADYTLTARLDTVQNRLQGTAII